MDSSTLLGITTFTYLFATILYTVLFIFKLNNLGKLVTWFTGAALLIQTIAIGLRWHESYVLGIGHAPLTNMYESVVFFAWSIVALYLFIEWKYKTRIIGAFIVPFAFLAMAYASISTDINKSISPLVPALQSNWLIAHVVTCFIAYAAFAVAAGLGMMYLVKIRSKNFIVFAAFSIFVILAFYSVPTIFSEKPVIYTIGYAIVFLVVETALAIAAGFLIKYLAEILHTTLPSQKVIDTIIHSVMIFGFIWLTIGIITGAVWANSAWGTYWSWDPKETWSLITWFIYAITLHARYTRGWGGPTIAWLAILGFVSVIFTYYGVNFLLSGLHSYGSG